MFRIVRFITSFVSFTFFFTVLLEPLGVSLRYRKVEKAFLDASFLPILRQIDINMYATSTVLTR